MEPWSRRWYGQRRYPCPARPPQFLAQSPSPATSASSPGPCRGDRRWACGVRLGGRFRGAVQPRRLPGCAHPGRDPCPARLWPAAGAHPAARAAGRPWHVLLADRPHRVLRVGGVRLQGQLVALAPLLHRSDQSAAGPAPGQERGHSGVDAGRLGPGEAVSMPPLPTRAITIVGFLVLVLAMIVLEILARRPGSRIPTVGQWLGYLMRPKLGRFLILLGWWWLGWHYFAR